MTSKALREKKTTRKENAEKTLEAIYQAALKVVGNYGYADASIAKITEEAGIAQGTFYLYFESRQALFDQLLPYAGKEMLLFLKEHVKGSESFIQVEERGFRAFFRYVEKHPGFMRVLNEAEVAAPEAFRKYFQLVSRIYVQSLKRSHDRGDISLFSENEFTALSYLLMGARTYLHLRYVKSEGKPKKMPESVIQTFLKVLRHGIQ